MGWNPLEDYWENKVAKLYGMRASDWRARSEAGARQAASDAGLTYLQYLKFIVKGPQSRMVGGSRPPSGMRGGGRSGQPSAAVQQAVGLTGAALGGGIAGYQAVPDLPSQEDVIWYGAVGLGAMVLAGGAVIWLIRR